MEIERLKTYTKEKRILINHISNDAYFNKKLLLMYQTFILQLHPLYNTGLVARCEFLAKKYLNCGHFVRLGRASDILLARNFEN